LDTYRMRSRPQKLNRSVSGQHGNTSCRPDAGPKTL